MPTIDLTGIPKAEPTTPEIGDIDLTGIPAKVTKPLTSPERLPRWEDVKGKLPANLKDYEQAGKDAISVAATYDLDMNAAYNIQDKVKEELGETDLFDKAVGSFKAGIGDVYVGLGNTLKWAGMSEEFSDVYVDYGERMRVAYIPPEDTSEFTWRKTIDPEWWATSVTRAVPFTLSLIPAAVVGAYAGTAAAGAAGLGTFGTTVMGSLGGAAASRPLESAFEAAAAYEESLARGDSEEEANAAADKVFASNMMLVGMDAAQFAVAFTPLKFGKTLNPSLLRRISAGTGKLSAVALSEAGEERYQEYVQMEALGEEANFFDLDNPRLNEASTIGGIFGAGMGGTGSVWTALTKKTTEAMPEDVKQTFDVAKGNAMLDGMEEADATRVALDAVAETPEGKEHIEKVINDLKEASTKEMGAKAPEITAPTMEQLMERLQTEDLTEEELGSLLDQFAGGREMEIQSEPVAAIKERLIATGMDEVEASANAALFDGFRVLAQRAGVPVEDVMARYLPEVSREGVEAPAPVVTEEDRRAITDNPFLSDQITTEEQLTDVESLRTARERINETLVEQREEQTVSDEEMKQLEEAVGFLDEKAAQSVGVDKTILEEETVFVPEKEGKTYFQDDNGEMTLCDFKGSCDRFRKTPEGERVWQEMMKTRQEITEDEFLENVNIEDVLDEGETWEQYKEVAEMEGDPVKIYKSEQENIYFFQHAGFEFIWQKPTEEFLQSKQVESAPAIPDTEAVADMDVLEQSAYHGTPHKFDKFTLDHIGTGEGAQAYGWGLYFAENKGVAKWYRENLAAKQGTLIIDGESISMEDPEAYFAALDVLTRGYEETRQKAESDVEWARRGVDDAIEAAGIDSEPHNKAVEWLEDRTTYFSNIVSLEGKEIKRGPKSGALLKVELAPKADEWLDWDKRLSEQSETVQKALAQADDSFNPDRIVYEPEMAGKRIYERLKITKGGPREASMYLKSIGVPGIRYLDATSRGKEKGTSNYVVFDDELITIEEYLQAKQEGITPEEPRGRIRISPDGINIDLLKGADQSTFVHETGHLYYKMLSDLAVLPTASEDLKADYQTVRDWLGAEEGADLTVDQQEQFARGFEAYLREGKAPSSALAEAFENFKQWLMQIYKSLRDLNVQLTDEVRGVMDRMLADEGVERAEAVQVTPLTEGVDADGVVYEQGAAKTDTEAFRRWSENGEIVEPEDVNDYEFRQDEPVVLKVFHGTTHKFDVFDAKRGNLEGQFGAINYFTSSELDAADNYAGEGPDLTNRIEQLAERLEGRLEYDDIEIVAEEYGIDVDELEAAKDDDVALRQLATKKLSGGDEQVMELFVKVKNPFVIGENAEWIEFVDNEAIESEAVARVADEEGLSVEDIEANRDEYEDQIDEARWEIEADTPHRLAEAIQEVSDRHGVEASSIAGEIYDLGSEARPEDIEQLLRSSEDYLYAEGPEGELIGSQLIAEVIEEMGFDSIILRNAEARFENMNIEGGTAHVHIFDSNKTNIKSVENVGTFGIEEPSIFEQAAPAKITNIRQLAKSLGGIDYNKEHLKGELNKLKEDAPATRLLINKRDQGVTLDRLLESAIEAGILSETATLDDLINALEVNLQTPEAIQEELAKEERVRRRAETKAYKTEELRKEFVELAVKARKAYREGKNYGAVKEARKLKNILARTRKLRLVRDYFNLTDADLKKISKKNPLLLSQYEFKLYLDDVRIKAAQLSQTQLEKAMLINMIHEKDLGRVDNYRRVLGLPTIANMTVEQVRTFAAALEPFHDGDVFLSERELETVDRTDLAGIATWREAKERLAAEIGVSIEELEKIKDKEWDEFKWDTALAEANPFYKMLVTETTRKLLEADFRYHEIENELYDLARKSEKSRGRTLVEKAIPQDKQVMEYLETPAEERNALAEEMTPEQIDLARYMEAYFEIALKYLIKTKSLDRGRENYFVHMRRTFLENVKEEGLVGAFKSLFKTYQEDEAVFNIMDEDTGNILPLEKFFQFSLRRTGGIDPTTNVIRAFLTYAQMMEKKISLDELIPKMDIYAQSITPQTFTPRGLETDRSIKKFVNKYINNKKGRRIRWVGKQGGTIDVSIRGLRTFTTVVDLGLNIPSGIAAFTGEQVTNFAMLGTKAFAKGNARIATKKGKKIINKYEAFIGRSAWEEFTAPGKQLTERISDGMFGLFHEASVLANKQFLLGAITDEEYNSGEITSERLAILKIEMGRLRVVPGTKSMVGSTSAGSAMMQYKTWAAPIISTMSKDAATLVRDLAKKPTGEALTSREAREIYRLIGITTTALIVGATALSESDDDTFTGQMLKKVYRESMTLLQGVDPSLWLATPRLMGFLTQLGKNLKAIATLEEYKTKPGLKGVEGLQRQLTPRAIKQFIPKETKKEKL